MPPQIRVCCKTVIFIQMDRRSRHQDTEQSRRTRRTSRSPAHRDRSSENRYRSPRRRDRSSEREHRFPEDSRRSRSRRSPSPRDRVPQRRRSPSPYTDESTKDARTVFITQLPQNFSDKKLHDYFSIAGRIKGAKIVTDKLTGKSKGIAYVEFYTIQSAEYALGLNGDKIDGFVINVQPSETNRISTIEQATSAVRRVKLPTESKKLPSRLLVRNIHGSIKEESLYKVFGIFGRIATLHFAPDPDNSTLNVALVEFDQPDDAQSAIRDLDSFILGGIPLMIHRLDEQSESQVTELLGGSRANFGVIFQILNAKDLMFPALKSQSIDSASSCIQLSNMYDPEEESSSHWEFEVADDIREECSKLGKITHLHVQKNKNGDVYVKFQDQNAAQKAIDLFDGRWFGLRQIGCRYIPENLYNDMFTF